ncbi:unnamed protein product [Cunninghamella blakesleeana]
MRNIITLIAGIWLAVLFVAAGKPKNGLTDGWTECSMTDPKCPKGYVQDKSGICNKWERKIHCVKGIETECAMTADPKCPKGYKLIKKIICNKWERKALCAKKK